ncbi:MAG: hypothetical protein Q4G58_17325, partial [bacterium]|nr:hypothetical protein [bacterium]
MFRREKDLDKFKVCLIDLLCVICSCFFTYQLPYNDLSQNSAVFIGILHILVFYLGNEYYHFYRRGYLEELKAVIIYELEMIIAMMV